ncbi:MAG: DUF192 domain-containing protein [Alphaproteobacteria bacterium]|nr:DUF192 domain-containing protein [Alphaproteobacteria bacterium]
MPKIFKVAMMLLAVVACSKFDKRYELTITDINGEKAVYKVELAQTKEEMSVGLMNREKLDENSGMLFALGSLAPNTRSAMWMKDTKISLDMLFIDNEGMIFWIYENAEPESEKLIVPPYPAYSVLEVNAGDVKKYGIKIGDMVKHEWFKEEITPADVTKTETPVAEEESEEVAVEELVTEEVATEEENKTDDVNDDTSAETPVTENNTSEEIVENKPVILD